MGNRINTLLSVVGVRFGGAGLIFTLAPRWVRNLFADFIKLSDNEMRVIGYVLLGTAATLLAQQATARTLSARLDALAKEQPRLAGA